MKIIRISILTIIACLVTQCGTFNASYTDQNGTTYHGGIETKKLGDNK